MQLMLPEFWQAQKGQPNSDHCPALQRFGSMWSGSSLCGYLSCNCPIERCLGVDQKSIFTLRKPKIHGALQPCQGYAVTDAGFYFGTQLVATKSGSEQLGLLTAFGYAVLMTCLVLRFAQYLQWNPQSIYAGRLLSLATWLVCYAWWYPWQELLYQIQGYGLWNLNLKLAGMVTKHFLQNALDAYHTWFFTHGASIVVVYCLSFESTQLHSDSCSGLVWPCERHWLLCCDCHWFMSAVVRNTSTECLVQVLMTLAGAMSFTLVLGAVPGIGSAPAGL